jgi:hypothetical protein
MQRRGCGLGCIFALLGLALSFCLLPYLISSIYSVVSAVLQVPGTPTWLWGDWLSSVVGTDTPLYMIMAEGPICCVGVLGLLIIILGIIVMIRGIGTGDKGLTEGYDIYEDVES